MPEFGGKPAHFTAGDGYRWAYREFVPNGSPRARVVCIHGIQSHGGWYLHSCNRLAAAGYAVSFLDRRGAGLNEAARGDTPSFRRLLDDVAEYLRDQRAKHVQHLFLLGISWGGKIATAVTHRCHGLVDGLILVAPGFVPRIGLPVRQRLAILAARLVNPRRLFAVPLSDAELFTMTPLWQDFVRADPLSLRAATARFFVESVRLDWYLQLNRARITVPVLMLLAEKDRIIDNARTEAFLARLPSLDKHIIEYPGAHHTMEFDADPEPYIADIVAWLDRQVARFPVSNPP
jgi:alpha-beta hydrolase superfamily lysophospholipase